VAIQAKEFPSLLVNNRDKSAILNKIKTDKWASRVFNDLKNRVYPYVSHYSMTTEYDPTWLTSRYLLNREKGRYYTHLRVSKNGLEADSVWGNAPAPTIRYSIGESRPETRDIFPYRLPTVDDLLPYNTKNRIPLFNSLSRKYDLVDPSKFSEVINGQINRIALDAAVLYWLTQEKEYARLAADVFQQWVTAANYQNPIIGSRYAGLFSSRINGDTEYAPMLLVYDFLGDYLAENGYDTTCYQAVFEKLARTLISNGEINDFAMKSPMLVYSVLSIENPLKRDKLLGFVIEKDTVIARDFGNLSLRSALNKLISKDGFFKDPGKHATAIYNLLLSVWALEKNNVQVLNAYNFPVQMGEVRMYSAFPDLSLPVLGDINHPHPDGKILELSLALNSMKRKGNTDELHGLLNLLVKRGKYAREEGDLLGLLMNVPDNENSVLADDFWKRTGVIDYAKYYFQRNGMNPQNGLMCGVQGATYSGNHANGMSAEFYGLGRVMGVDPGIGKNQRDSMHIQFYTQWAAHNTVVAAGSSSPERIYKGGGTAKSIGQIELVSMEPSIDSEAVSLNQSFTYTKYLEPFTKTNEERVISLIRTSPTSGFYVDIFRADNDLWNDYLYHNIGTRQTIYSKDRQLVLMHKDTIPLVEPDFPGLRFIKETQTTGETDEGLISLFALEKEKSGSSYMQVLMPGVKGRSYYTGMSPKSELSAAPYDSLSLPTLLVHNQGEAFNKPFVSVLEPFQGADKYEVLSVDWLNHNFKGKQTSLNIVCKNNRNYWILSSADSKRRGYIPGGSFWGTFATVEWRQDSLASVYIGKGQELQCKGFVVRGESAELSANVIFNDKSLEISSNEPLRISWDKFASRKLYYIECGSEEKKQLMQHRGYFELPALQNVKVYIDE